MFQIVDIHMHCIPFFCGFKNGEWIMRSGKYGKVRLKKGVEERWMPPSFVNSNTDPEMLIEYMDWVGVDKAVLLQAPCYGDHNEYIAEVLEKYPDKFIAGFAVIDPREDIEKIIARVEYTIGELNFKGVKFEPPDTPFWLDDSKYDLLWEKIIELDCFLALDLGLDKESPYSFQLEQLKSVVRKFPSLKLIVLHLGWSKLWDREQKYPFPILQDTLSLAKYSSNVWFGLSSIQEMEEGEYPYPRTQEIIKAAFETVGSDKLLWGSDFPSILRWCTYKQALDLVKEHCDFLGEKDKRLILGENAIKLFSCVSH